MDSDSIKSKIPKYPVLPTSPLVLKKNAKDFLDISIGIYANNDKLDTDERTLFLRLSVILGDVLLLETRQ